MTSFQAKICWKRLRKRENKNYRSVSFLPDGQEKIPKKQQKKLRKLKKTITDSYQAKIGGKMLRKRENKNYHSVSFIPDGEENFQKNSKKIQKIEKYHYGFIPSQNMLEKAEKVRK